MLPIRLEIFIKNEFFDLQQDLIDNQSLGVFFINHYSK